MSKNNPAAAIIKLLLKKDITPEEIKSVSDQLLELFSGTDSDLTKALDEVSSLGSKLETLQAGYDRLKDTNDELTGKLSSGNERFDLLNSQLDELQSSNAGLQSDLDDALSEVQRLGSQLEAQQDLEEGQFLVDVDGESHILIGNRFSFKGHGELDAKALSKNKELLSQMKANNSGALVPVNK